ncbi:MAG: AraC family transcriptional regulator [Roseivirga sp.]|nr:AraC family transcriptional regulator [Roseivirga sp.]
MADLCDQSTDAGEIFHWCDQILIERLTAAGQTTDLAEFIRILEMALLSGIRSTEAINPIISHFTSIGLSSQLRVSEISDSLGVTDRHLRELSRKHIGHSPKSMLQIERFTRSLILSNHSREWTSIAHDSGYYDQSHMIAEYQKMCGQSPERLFG